MHQNFKNESTEKERRQDGSRVRINDDNKYEEGRWVSRERPCSVRRNPCSAHAQCLQYVSSLHEMRQSMGISWIQIPCLQCDRTQQEFSVPWLLAGVSLFNVWKHSEAPLSTRERQLYVHTQFANDVTSVDDAFSLGHTKADKESTPEVATWQLTSSVNLQSRHGTPSLWLEHRPLLCLSSTFSCS